MDGGLTNSWDFSARLFESRLTLTQDLKLTKVSVSLVEKS